MVVKINGKVDYIELEGGFWGIKTNSENYLPIDLPEQLQQKGETVVCTVEVLDIMTTHNWGVPCKVLSFTTLDAE
jgi:hypothetical protein